MIWKQSGRDLSVINSCGVPAGHLRAQQAASPVGTPERRNNRVVCCRHYIRKLSGCGFLAPSKLQIYGNVCLPFWTSGCDPKWVRHSIVLQVPSHLGKSARIILQGLSDSKRLPVRVCHLCKLHVRGLCLGLLCHLCPDPGSLHFHHSWRGSDVHLGSSQAQAIAQGGCSIISGPCPHLNGREALVALHARKASLCNCDIGPMIMQPDTIMSSCPAIQHEAGVFEPCFAYGSWDG